MASTHETSAGTDGFNPEPNLLQWQRARDYVVAVGVREEKRESAAAQIARLLAVSEESQAELFDYLPKPKKKTKGRVAETEQRTAAAAAFRNPTDPEALRAAFGEGSRISSIIPELVSNPSLSWDIRGTVIKTARDFAVLAQALRTPYVEMTKVAFLNRNGVVLHSEILSIGSAVGALLAPSMVARALQRLNRPEGSQRVLLSHNHPSGECQPSAADVQITQVFNKACEQLGYEFVDHIVTNGDNFFSFREQGFISSSSGNYGARVNPKEGDPAVPKADLGRPAAWEIVRRSELHTLNRAEVVLPIYNALRQVDDTAAYILILNRKNKLTGLERVSEFSKRPDFDALKRKIFTGLGREGGTAFILTVPDAIPATAALAGMRNLRDWARAVDMDFLDFFHASIKTSARDAGVMDEPSSYTRTRTKAPAAKKGVTPTDPLKKYVRAVERIAKRARKGELNDEEQAKAIIELVATLDGPDPTGIPLRVDTRKYIAGITDREALEGRVRDHLAARQVRIRRRELNLAMER